MIGGQLWALTSGDCMMLSHTTRFGSIFTSAPRLPVVYWPNGIICVPATTWLISKARDRRLSSGRTSPSESIITDASLISLFVRFVSANSLAIEDITDDHFFQWATELAEERDPRNPQLRRRKTTQIGRIMRRALTFLIWYQDNYLLDQVLIGQTQGCRVRYSVKHGRGRGKHSYHYIHHRAIPKNSTPSDVKPIGHSNITKLYDAISHIAKKRYVRRRIQETLRLLEAVGGRRIEITKLTVEDIRRAYKTQMLIVSTAKTSDWHLREIPIDRSWIEPIIAFIEGPRQALVDELKKQHVLKQDPGDLLLGVGGAVISEKTITKEVNLLARKAGIQEKTCPHMFRHRFITIQVAHRLKEYIGQHLPMDVAHSILVKVAELTGHKDPMSLWKYIDLAWDELRVWDVAERVLRFRARAEGSLRQIETLMRDNAGELSNSTLTRAMQVLRDLVDYDSVGPVQHTV